MTTQQPATKKANTSCKAVGLSPAPFRRLRAKAPRDCNLGGHRETFCWGAAAKGSVAKGSFAKAGSRTGGATLALVTGTCIPQEQFTSLPAAVAGTVNLRSQVGQRICSFFVEAGATVVFES